MGNRYTGATSSSSNIQGTYLDTAPSCMNFATFSSRAPASFPATTSLRTFSISWRKWCDTICSNDARYAIPCDSSTYTPFNTNDCVIKPFAFTAARTSSMYLSMLVDERDANSSSNVTASNSRSSANSDSVFSNASIAPSQDGGEYTAGAKYDGGLSSVRLCAT